MEAWELGVRDLQAGIRAGEVSPLEAVRACLERIEALDDRVGAFRQVLAEEAMRDATMLSDELVAGEPRSTLHGIPVAVKELFDVAGAMGCYGSEVFADRVSPADAEVVRRLRAAGAIVVGLTRSHELGWGITTQHHRLGSTRNPWALDRVPGGSSGGSAAALATGMAPLAVGSDTGGSIRIPAGYCGVAGLKPTYGRIPKRGGVALAPSLDHPGPMARTAADLADAFLAMAGYDVEDPSTFRRPEPSLEGSELGLDGLRVGVAPDLHLTPLTEDYERVFRGVVTRLEEAGCEIVEVPVPAADRIRPAFGSIQMAEAHHYHSTTLGTYPERSGDYGGDVRRRLQLASNVTLQEYLAAREAGAEATRALDVALGEVDALVTPVAAGGPSTTDDPDEVDYRGGRIPFRDLVMDYTVPQDLTGLPAAVVTAGWDSEGIPIGVQLTAGRAREDLAMRVAIGLETALDIQRTWPALGAS